MQGGVAIVVPGTQIRPRSHQGRNDGGIIVVSGRKVQGSPAFLILLDAHIRLCSRQGRDDSGVAVAPGCKMQRGIAIVVPDTYIRPSSEAIAHLRQCRRLEELSRVPLPTGSRTLQVRSERLSLA